jgi:hypothetical protein
MDLRRLSDGINLERIGREAPFPSWSSGTDSWLFPIQTGDNAAGNGGDGYFAGSLIDSPYGGFEPFNMAQSGFHSTANAGQTNIAFFDQHAVQLAGNGGDGGNVNAAAGGEVALSGGSSDPGAVGTGDNGAGNGGDGHFAGAMVHAPVAIYDPVNIAVAGSNSTADAHQLNTAVFHQSAFQAAGGGGGGGGGNASIGGNVSFGTIDPSILTSAHGPLSDAIISYLFGSGDNHAGNGGDGYFHGSIVHVSFALYDPINIAVAGYNSTATADQTNNVIFDQSALQLAGNGGHGGSGNAALGGSGFGLIGSDTVATGGNGAGNGGDGHFDGSLFDVSIAIFAPINIAVAGYNSTADAHQTNNVLFDQHAIQLAGNGGDGGNFNAALGGDLTAHILMDPHLLGHA